MINIIDQNFQKINHNLSNEQKQALDKIIDSKEFNIGKIIVTSKIAKLFSENDITRADLFEYEIEKKGNELIRFNFNS